jgi:hypothetical protein
MAIQTDPTQARRIWMTIEDRVETLRAKHARLDHEIDEEVHRPLPDTVHVTELKREKLRIKEEIQRISR